MAKEELIPVADFCVHHSIDVSFLQTLQTFGLVKLTTVREMTYLHPGELTAVEKLVHLYNDLDVNVEGLDVIRHLLQRMEHLQAEMVLLKNRLRFHDANA